MKTRTQQGSALLSVDIKGTVFSDLTVGSVEIDQMMDAHDVAVITINGMAPRAVMAYQERPVSIDVALTTHARVRFHGYVNHIEPEHVTSRGLINRSPVQQAQVTCLGASRDMRGKRTAVWEGYSMPELVRSIAGRYGYSFSVPRTTTRGRWTQRGESDFALLAKAAGSMGYKVTIHGTHIHIWDPARAMGRGLPSARLTAPVQARGQVARTVEPGQIMEMHGTFGTTPEGDPNLKRVSFLDVDGNALSIDSDHLDLPQTTGRRARTRQVDEYTFTAGSYDEAERRLTAAVKDHAPFRAHLTVRGLPFVVPGSMVEIVGYEGHYDGFWLVHSIKHVVVRDNFISELEVSRDSVSDAPARPLPVASAKPPPEPILVGDYWRSSLASEEIYV